MKKINLIFIIIFLKTIFCIGQNNPPLIILGEPELDKVKLLAFVGEKISIEKQPTEKYSMDSFYMAKYKILKVVYGKVEIDTVEFRVYDHYGFPRFGAFKNVLLYISQDKNGGWYHQKYQYSPVYETIDGRWATPGKDREYYHVYNEGISIKPEKIIFKENLCINVSKWSKENIETAFSEPYYKLKNKEACH